MKNRKLLKLLKLLDKMYSVTSKKREFEKESQDIEKVQEIITNWLLKTRS